MSWNRISIIGGPGTGKTTLSNELSKLYNIPAIHIDGIHHLENWKIRDKDERDKMILDIVKQEKWIIDGTYKATLKVRLEKADLVIWLDYPTWTQIKGVIMRRIKLGGKEREEIPGCKERMSKEFFTYVLKYNKEKRKVIVDNLEGIDESKLLIFKKQRDLNKWLKKQKGIK
ncbi:MAG: topology modulation protein [Clostridia bacterium]|nr:topology modulation protein [Clostridia bacterium]